MVPFLHIFSFCLLYKFLRLFLFQSTQGFGSDWIFVLLTLVKIPVYLHTTCIPKCDSHYLSCPCYRSESLILSANKSPPSFTNFLTYKVENNYSTSSPQTIEYTVFPFQRHFTRQGEKQMHEWSRI